MSSDPDAAATLLGRAIDRHRRAIERIWLERVGSDVAKTPGVELTHLRNAMPDYLHSLVRLLCETGISALDATAHEAWAKVARDHGVTRVRIGFDVTQLIHEFVVLRHVIRDVALSELPELPDERQPEAVLADCVDAAIAAAVEAYVQARDHEARRTQAKNIGFLIHELRNPLASATLASARLRRHAVPEQAHALDAIDRALVRLTELIDGVLLTEKFEAGEVESQPRRVELGQILDDIIVNSRETARQKGLGFRVSYDPALALEIDPALTRSAIQNLVDNAVKYTDAGEVDVRVEDAGELLELHVRDTCHGISAQELRTIFEPFKRGRTSKTGTGLGLAIARRSVQAQGGAIHAESGGHSGCHFWIELPKRARAERSA